MSDDLELARQLDHLVRPGPPWRQTEKTECGLPTANLPTITRDELDERMKKLGQRRTLFGACVTCWETARRHPTWDRDPAKAYSRDFGYHKVHGAAGDQLSNELRALEALWSAHRDEYEAHLAALTGTLTLTDARRRRTRRRLQR